MVELFFHPILVQATGIIAALFLMYCFQTKTRGHILLYLSIGIAFQIVHLLQLGAITGAALNVLTLVRNGIFHRRHTSAWAAYDWWPYAFSFLFIVIAYFTWQGYESIFPLIGVVMATFAFWLTEPKHIRFFGLFAAVAWLPYGFIIDSYPTILLQLFIIGSILIAMWRLDRPSML